MKKLLMTLALCASLVAAASPDHDHGAPTFQPKKKNGMLQSAHSNHFELAREGNKLSLYVYDEKGNDVTTKGFKLDSKVELPKKKILPLSFKDMKTHWEADLDWQGAHRATLKISIDDGKDKDSVKFTLENK